MSYDTYAIGTGVKLLDFYVTLNITVILQYH